MADDPAYPRAGGAPRQDGETGRPDRRILIFSQRGLSNHLSRCGIYEFEDLLSGAGWTEPLDAAGILAPKDGLGSPYRLKLRNRLSRLWGPRALPASGLVAPEMRGTCDLFFFYVGLVRDLLTLDAVPGWRARSGKAICWLQELWVDDIARYGRQLDILNRFDHVICAMEGSVPALQARLDVPVSYMPWGVDTILFCPFAEGPAPARWIHVNNISRIAPVTHDALLAHARATGRHYEFTTIRGGAHAHEPAEHRWLYAQRTKRSDYLVCYKAKVADIAERGAQEEFGLRYIEGVAGGAVLLGDRVARPAFEAHLGWEDAVIPIPYDCPDIGARLDALEADPARLEAARRRNVAEALARHDHLHRWREILKLAGLPAHPAMAPRAARLEALAGLPQTAPEPAGG